MMCLFLLQLTKSSSIYGAPGTDTVQVQESNSVENLGHKTRHIRHYYLKDNDIFRDSSAKIKDNDYPYPGHPATDNFNKYSTAERNLIDQHYCKVIQDTDLDTVCKKFPETTEYYCPEHPAGVEQFNGDEKTVFESQRSKFRVYINTRYGYYHWTGIYLPPGQLVTIDVPTQGVKTIQAKINRHTDQDTSLDRLQKLHCDITLHPGENKITWPIGGILEFTVPLHSFDKGLVINVTGGIKVPTFIYGVHTDKEFETEFTKSPCPLSLLENGNMKIVVPTSYLKTGYRFNDIMLFWRGVGQILSSVKDLKYYPRGDKGNVLIPLQVGIGGQGSSSFPGFNILQVGKDQCSSLLNYEANKWDVVGLYGEHFSDGWGDTDYYSFLGTAKKIFAHMMRSRFEIFDGRRQIDSYGNYYDGNNEENHLYQTINSTDIVWLYENPMMVFGLNSQRQLLHDHINQTYFKRINYDYYSELLLHMTKLFNRDMRPYFNSFKDTIHYTIPENVDKEIEEMKLEKEFHPVCTIYQCGYFNGTEEVITSQPFQIPARRCYMFDFQKYMKTRTGTHIFKFENIDDSKLKGNLTKVEGSEAIYKYMPAKNNFDIDTFYVSYKDTEKIGSSVIVIIKVKQVFNGAHAKYMNNTGFPTGMLDAYRKFNSQQNDVPQMMKYDDTKLGNDIPGNDWIGVLDVKFYPTESGDYKFVPSETWASLLYVSDKKLSQDPDKDAGSLKWHIQESDNVNRNTYINEMKFIHLEKDKPVYIRLVVSNNNKPGSNEIHYIKKDDNKEYPLPMDRCFFPCSFLGDTDKNAFVPNYENDASLGIYRDSPYIEYDSSSFKYKNDTDFDADIDFGVNLSFDRIYIHQSWKGKLELNLDNKQVSRKDITGEQTAIPSTLTGQHIQLKVLNDDRTNIVKNPPLRFLMTAGNSKNIIPVTHSQIKKKGNVELITSGIYYNGKGLLMHPGSSIEFKIHPKGDNIAILGDRSPRNGKCNLYVNGNFKVTFDTSILATPEGATTDRQFLMPLYNLNEGIQKDWPYTIKIEAKERDVVIAGILADGQLDGSSSGARTVSEASSADNVQADEDCECQAREPSKEDGSKDKNPPYLGLVIGLTVALVVVIAISVGLVLFFLLKKKKAEISTEESSPTASTTTRGEVSYNHYF